jgi:hypothetical protein
MGTGTKDNSGEPVDHWKRIVQAVWALNYVCVSFKSIIPRVSSLPQSLDDLKALIPLLEKRATTNILERELKTMMDEFRQATELLDVEAGKIRDLLSLLEEHRARLKER